ncbi:PE-PPE domain-containing protein [Mycobacterium shimoidei]|uniref:PE-PPE domain-containing protein n=1 Tax=Mycobacterium shimoidei TaxID=29313 RepID=UPI000848B793|nr:PE-PPE domain-containing protein [Mycobacterium shimoidei]MCV7257767.1 PE-PPE domain-containing protein [Mycobacterium shimoidei]ODR11985.1 hypothetical protein BHQ16_18015 [Mycobacterium shimoidei]ORW81489.1 hypothetical protein AWC26_07525 [Mycobacterium shimoidei]
MRDAPGFWVTVSVASVFSAGLIALPPAAPTDIQVHSLRLAGADISPPGDAAALVMGPSGIPIPPPGYVDAANSLYLQPNGFSGTAQGLAIPNGLYPVTGVKSLPTDTSFALGQQILDSAIQSQIAGGHVDAANPLVVFGWSQSSSVSSLTMSQLAGEGVPSDDVHFVLLGNPSNPNGGVLERFDVPAGTDPSFPSLGITFSGAAPDDLYPTDVYTVEYDGFADFPRYPLNLLADLNAFVGLILAHGLYLGFTPEQIASAVPLPTVGDTLTNYYMIPAGLPLLEPLQLIPGIGQALYDLLEPDIKILVDLGYGHVDTIADVANDLGGWDYGPANVPTPFGLFPENIDLVQLVTVLGQGAELGITNAIQDLQNPDPTIPWLSTLENEASALGFDINDPQELLNNLLGFIGFPASDATLQSPPLEIINDLAGILAADYATLLPIADTATALFTDLPLYDLNVFMDQLEAGNLLDAIGDPIAADTALIPFALVFGGLAPVGEAALGTLISLANLFL